MIFLAKMEPDDLAESACDRLPEYWEKRAARGRTASMAEKSVFIREIRSLFDSDPDSDSDFINLCPSVFIRGSLFPSFAAPAARTPNPTKIP